MLAGVAESCSDVLECATYSLSFCVAVSYFPTGFLRFCDQPQFFGKCGMRRSDGLYTDDLAAGGLSRFVRTFLEIWGSFRRLLLGSLR